MRAIAQRSKGLIGLAILGTLVVLAVGCTPSHPQSTFDTLGPVAESQAQLFYIIFWAGSFVFVVTMAGMLYAAIRYRRRPGQGDPEQIHGHTGVEIAWTIIPAIILAVIAVPTVIAIFDNENSPKPPEEGGLLVKAIGHQWWFEFVYPDHNVVTANELHIPVGEVINIQLESVDVIHSFWVPKLAGKVDMVPNNDNTIWLKANVAGEYFGQCAEFCGVSHANMRFKVIAQPRPEFEAWLEAQAADAVEPFDPLAKEGQELFVSRQGGCFACHTINGTERARGETGPNLTHLASRGDFAGSIMENTQENLRKWMHDPDKMKPGNIMARDAGVFNGRDEPLTETQIEALIAYLRSLN